MESGTESASPNEIESVTVSASPNVIVIVTVIVIVVTVNAIAIVAVCHHHRDWRRIHHRCRRLGGRASACLGSRRPPNSSLSHDLAPPNDSPLPWHPRAFSLLPPYLALVQPFAAAAAAATSAAVLFAAASFAAASFASASFAFFASVAVAPHSSEQLAGPPWLPGIAVACRTVWQDRSTRCCHPYRTSKGCPTKRRWS